MHPTMERVTPGPTTLRRRSFTRERAVNCSPARSSGTGADSGFRTAGPDRMRVWRPVGATGVVALRARGTAHRWVPCGEDVVAYLAHGGLRIDRSRERHPLRPGELGFWGTDQGGSCSTVQAWEASMLVIELPSFAEVVADPEGCAPSLGFPDPVLRDPDLASSFLRLHRTLIDPSSAREHQASLASWRQQLAELVPTGARRDDDRRLSARSDPALRTACEILHDVLETDVDLASLAAAAGVTRFRLIRLFKTGLGLPPHRYQTQLRVQRARTLLEAGHSPTEVPYLVGFYDQSHLNRHFTRRIGLTPGRYAHAFRGADTGAEPRASTRRSEGVHSGWRAVGPVAAGTASRAGGFTGSVTEARRPLLAS